jgi:hypothetical protein
MKMKYFMTIFLFGGFLLFSCSQNNQKKTKKEISQEKVVVTTETKSPEIFGITGEDIVIRTGPGDQFDKLINQKATEALGYTYYANVDYSFKVTIDEEKGEWSKIKVVEPEHLSASHIGWIPTKNILKKSTNKEIVIENLNSKNYEILKTNHTPSVQNFHVLIKQKGFDKETVFLFVQRFRHEYCSKNSNVYVYDSKSILPLIDKYPLEGAEYLKLADHFVSMSTFDAKDIKSWYPFQDIQYKEYGGKNWKKEPIK